MRVVQSSAGSRDQRSFRASNAVQGRELQTVAPQRLYFPAVDFLSSLAPRSARLRGYLCPRPGSVDAARVSLPGELLRPGAELSQLYNTFLFGPAALDKIMEVLDEEPEIVDRSAAFVLPRLEATGLRNVDSATGTCRGAPRNLAGRPPGPRWRSSGQTGAASRRSRS